MILCDILDTLWPAISTMPVMVPVILLPLVALAVSRAWSPWEIPQEAARSVTEGWWVIITTIVKV
jgi:hypothetical protein